MSRETKRILVLTDDMPWGHRSIARAIYGYLKKKEKENNWRVEYGEVKAEAGGAVQIYKFMYRFVPKLNQLSNKMLTGRRGRRVLESVCLMNLPKLSRLVEKVRPDVVISSYFYHSHTLARWRKRQGKEFVLWTVAADPRTIHESNFVSGADLHLVYDDYVEAKAIIGGVPKRRILKTGWWVRGEMYKKYDQQEARKKLGFKDKRPVIFVGGGSLGTSALPRLLPSLMLVKRPVGVIVNTGTDKLAYKMAEGYRKLFAKFKRTRELVEMKNFGWIDNMAEVLSAADIVFGKAGPNFLFDVVAVGKPFVAITHIGGQEDGNLDLIRRKKLGWVREKNASAAKFLMSYLENPEIYNRRFARSIAAEAERNKGSLAKVEERLKTILP